MKKITVHQALARSIKDFFSERSSKDLTPVLSELARLYDEKACLFFLPTKDADLSQGLATVNVGDKETSLALIAFTSLELARRELKKENRRNLSAMPIPFSEVWKSFSKIPQVGGFVIDYLTLSKDQIGPALGAYAKTTTTIQIASGDITNFRVDAIVNAANETLLGGGGVDGAIHRAAGPELREACKKLGGCKTGEAKITAGFKLPSRYVIHTVGPVYATDPEPEKHLADCYFNSLTLARENNLHTIAFPAISTGAYGYPFKEASEIAVDTVLRWARENNGYKIDVFFCFTTDDKCREFLNILQSPRHSSSLEKFR